MNNTNSISTESHHLPIDPFSTAYWADTNAPLAVSSTDAVGSMSDATLMNPPRLPLHVINRTNTVINGLATQSLTLLDSDGKIVNVTPNCAAPSKAQKPVKRLVAPELMPEFKKAIQGSDLTKAGLIEILKKQYVLAEVIDGESVDLTINLGFLKRQKMLSKIR